MPFVLLGKSALLDMKKINRSSDGRRDKVHGNVLLLSPETLCYIVKVSSLQRSVTRKHPKVTQQFSLKDNFVFGVQLRKAAQLAHRTPIQHSVDSVLDSVRKFSSRSAGLCGWEKSRASTARLPVVMLCLSAGVCCCFRGLIWKIGRNHQRHITIMRNAVNYRFRFFFEGFCCGKGSKWKYFPSSMRLTWRQASGSNLYSYIEQHFCPQKEAKNRFPKQQWCLFSGCYVSFSGEWCDWSEIYRKNLLRL